MKLFEEGVQAARAAGVALIVVENLYGYGPGVGTISEATPERATDSKGTVRRAMTRSLLDAHQSGRLRVAIGRASDYFGPRADNSGITALAVEPVAGGKTIRWTGNLDVPHSVAYLPDIARAYVQLGTSDAADGEVWILPHGEPVTGRGSPVGQDVSASDARISTTVAAMIPLTVPKISDAVINGGTRPNRAVWGMNNV